MKKKFHLPSSAWDLISVVSVICNADDSGCKFRTPSVGQRADPNVMTTSVAEFDLSALSQAREQSDEKKREHFHLEFSKR